MNIAVLGGNGFIGKELVDNLKINNDITSVTRESYNQYIGKHFDVLINASGSPKKYWAETHQLEDFDANVTSVHRSILDFKYDKYIYLSSIDAIYCSSVYGFHKYLAEKLIFRYCPNFLILELSTVIGKGLKKGVVYDLLNNQKLRVSKDSSFHLITTTEIANIITFLLDKGISNDYFAVGGTNSITVSEIAKILGVSYTVKPSSPVQSYNLDYYLKNLLNIYLLKSSEDYLREFTDANH